MIIIIKPIYIYVCKKITQTIVKALEIFFLGVDLDRKGELLGDVVTGVVVVDDTVGVVLFGC
jgi:hypothetical protein